MKCFNKSAKNNKCMIINNLFKAKYLQYNAYKLNKNALYNAQ